MNLINRRDLIKNCGVTAAELATGAAAPSANAVAVNELDYKDGATVRHWRRSRTMDGATAYRLDWNGLSFMWTGDGKPDQLTARYARSVDVFVIEMVVDNPFLWALKQGAPTESRRVHAR